MFMYYVGLFVLSAVVFRFLCFFRVFKNVSCRFSYCCAVVFYE